MFQNKDVAIKINKLIVDYRDQLSASLAVVQRECSTTEFETYGKAVGMLMGYSFTEVAGPIYERYPDLMSDGLKSAMREYREHKKET